MSVELKLQILKTQAFFWWPQVSITKGQLLRHFFFFSIILVQ